MDSDMKGYYQVNQSRGTFFVVSSPIRKIILPGGRVMKKLSFLEKVESTNLAQRINDAEVVIAPPKEMSAVLPTQEQLTAGLAPKNVPASVLSTLKAAPWIRMLALLLMLLFLLLMFFIPVLGVVAVLLF